MAIVRKVSDNRRNIHIITFYTLSNEFLSRFYTGNECTIILKRAEYLSYSAKQEWYK